MVCNDHTDAEFERRQHAYEMGETTAAERAWSRFYDEAERVVIANGWSDARQGLDGDGDIVGFCVDYAYDAFRVGLSVDDYIASVRARRMGLGLPL